MSIHAMTATLVVFTAAGICSATDAPNLVPNGSFEQGWEHWEKVRDGDACAVSESAAHRGRRSLRIDTVQEFVEAMAEAKRTATDP